MPLRYVLDEQMPAPLWKAIQQHNAVMFPPVDVVYVGGPPDLPKGTPDPDILIWAEREGRILVSLDKGTLPTHLVNHLQAGQHCPGILIIRKGIPIPHLVTYLASTAQFGDPLAFQDTITYVP